MLVTTCGILVTDIIAAGLPAVATPGELLYTPRGIHVSIGGHPANVSIDLIKLGLPKGEVSLTGPVGDDPFGTFVANVLREYSVEAHLQTVKNVGTCKDMILVVKGEDRRFHVDVGANIYLDQGLVKAWLREEKPFLFYVGATGLLGSFDDKLAETLEEAKGLGCVTFVDVVKPYQKGWDFLFPAFKYMDLFHCNIDEAKSITGKTDLYSASQTLIQAGVGVTLVTLGERGGYARARTFRIAFPAFKINVVDPSGAGDAFCAGIILKLVEEHLRTRIEEGKPRLVSVEKWVETLTFAAAAGAVCCMAEGTTTSVSRVNVEKLLAEQGDDFHVQLNP